MKPIIALDLGRVTGWAARDGEAGIHFGSWVLGQTRDCVGKLLNSFIHNLGGLHSRFQPALIVYERPFIRAGVATSARPLVMYEGLVLAHGDFFQVETVHQDPARAKSGFGKPSLCKEDMVRIAREMGHGVDNHNEADALGHLYYRIGIESQGRLGIPEAKRKKR